MQIIYRFTILESSFRAKFWTQHCLYKEIKEDGKEGKIDLDYEFSEQDQSRTHKVGRWYRARVSSSRDRRDHVVDYHVLRSCMKSRRASLYASRRRSIQVTLDLREAGEARFFRRSFPPWCVHTRRDIRKHTAHGGRGKVRLEATFADWSVPSSSQPVTRMEAIRTHSHRA